MPPPQYGSVDEPLSTALIEVLLERPVIRAPHQLEDGYVWQDIVMVGVVGVSVWVFGGTELVTLSMHARWCGSKTSCKRMLTNVSKA